MIVATLIYAAVAAVALVVGLVSDQTLATINTIELLGIIYLAIAVSRLRARVAYLEGRMNGRTSRDEDVA